MEQIPGDRLRYPLAAALMALRKQEEALKDTRERCAICASVHHTSGEHPAPERNKLCDYCWRAECQQDGPCGLPTCTCMCTSRGKGN